MAEPNPKELFDRGKEIFNFASSGGGGTFRGDSLEAKEYYIQAKGYFEKACNLNYAKGCIELGGLYEGEALVIRENPSLKERLKKAVQYYSKACELNSGSGCYILGVFYNDRKDKDIKKVVQYFSKACELQNSIACSRLGVMQYVGKGVVKNKKQAMEKFEKACKLGKLGHKEACEIVTYKGLCELGHKEACEIVSLKMLCELSDEKACSMAYHKKKALGF
ncbi:cysteine-rich Sel1 repeat protein [Helicobacter pylori]|uniref:cysteine-rich Sel1 repeat protein n=1 Tax=Helicobacter pylori TaxID=210 RepID=UPI0005355961|nr:cysteine-rich Sel1 repeat protein [Helicobacter pylori]